MTTVEQFQKIASDIAAKYQFEIDKLHELVLSFKVAGESVEVARLLYDEASQTIGMQFQIEIINTDAIQMFSFAQHLCSEVKLLQCFYVSAQGEFLHGIDAQIMMEHDREHKMIQALAARERAQQEEAFQLKQMEKNGKITFH